MIYAVYPTRSQLYLGKIVVHTTTSLKPVADLWRRGGGGSGQFGLKNNRGLGTKIFPFPIQASQALENGPPTSALLTIPYPTPECHPFLSPAR